MPVEKRTRKRVKVVTGLIENHGAREVTYTSTVYSNGVPYTRTFSEVTRTHAKELHIQHQHEVRNEKLKPSDRDMTFEQLKTECLETLKKSIEEDGPEAVGMTERTRNNYAIALRRIPERDPIWSTKLSKFDDSVGVALVRRLRGLHKHPDNPRGKYEWKTVRETFTACQVVLRYGFEAKHMRGIDPLGNIPRSIRIPQHANEDNVKQALTPAGLRAIVRAAKSDEFIEATDTLLTNAVIQAFMEGERIGETRKTRWRDTDLVDGILTTRGTKNVRSMKRPQAAQIETRRGWERQLEHELAKGLGNPDDFVYTQPNGDPITHDQIRVAVERAGKLAGLGHITPMNGRKSVVTADRLAGVDREATSKKLGHAADVGDSAYFRPPHDIEALRFDRDRRAAYLNFDEEETA